MCLQVPRSVWQSRAVMKATEMRQYRPPKAAFGSLLPKERIEMVVCRTKSYTKFFAFSLLVHLSACGGGGGGDGGGIVAGVNVVNTSASEMSTGIFSSPPTEGIKFSASPSGLSGTTDSNGTFQYKTGDTVTFSLYLGGETFELGSTSNPASTNSVLSLAVPGGGNPLAVSQILQTLDRSASDGKLDVTGIYVSNPGALALISSSIRSKKVSESEISTVAVAVQGVLPTESVLKYGRDGVSSNQALSNLALNLDNRSLVETFITNLENDGSTLTDIQDKSAFTSWVVKNEAKMYYRALFGNFTSKLTYEFFAPSMASGDARYSGSFISMNENKNGSFTSTDSLTGIYKVKSSDAKGFAVSYSTASETGSISGTFLMSLTLDDLKSKTFFIDGFCNGQRRFVTVNSSAVSSDSCGGVYNGATWASGPVQNTLKYTDSSGKSRFVGITRINKNGGKGNFPELSEGVFMEITSDNWETRASQVAFRVAK